MIMIGQHRQSVHELYPLTSYSWAKAMPTSLSSFGVTSNKITNLIKHTVARFVYIIHDSSNTSLESHLLANQSKKISTGPHTKLSSTRRTCNMSPLAGCKEHTKIV